MAYPWVGGRGAACRAGGGEGAGLQSLAVLGGVGPSRVGRGALAWEAFLWGQKEFTVRAGSYCYGTRCPLQPVGLCD